MGSARTDQFLADALNRCIAPDGCMRIDHTVIQQLGIGSDLRVSSGGGGPASLRAETWGGETMYAAAIMVDGVWRGETTPDNELSLLEQEADRLERHAHALRIQAEAIRIRAATAPSLPHAR